jgi:hypothetical protein
MGEDTKRFQGRGCELEGGSMERLIYAIALTLIATTLSGGFTAVTSVPAPKGSNAVESPQIIKIIPQSQI